MGHLQPTGLGRLGSHQAGCPLPGSWALSPVQPGRKQEPHTSGGEEAPRQPPSHYGSRTPV